MTMYTKLDYCLKYLQEHPKACIVMTYLFHQTKYYLGDEDGTTKVKPLSMIEYEAMCKIVTLDKKLCNYTKSISKLNSDCFELKEFPKRQYRNTTFNGKKKEIKCV